MSFDQREASASTAVARGGGPRRRHVPSPLSDELRVLRTLRP